MAPVRFDDPEAAPAALRACANAIGLAADSAPTVKRYGIWRTAHAGEPSPSVNWFIGRYGSWQAACQVAKLAANAPVADPSHASGQRRYSDGDLCTALRRCETVLGYASKSAYSRYRLIDPTMPPPITITERLGTWTAAIAAAEIMPSPTTRARYGHSEAILGLLSAGFANIRSIDRYRTWW